MPFYKRDGVELLTAPTSVYAPGYTLLAEEKDKHSYPVDGWHWFDTLTAAMAALVTEPIKPDANATLAELKANALARIEAYARAQRVKIAGTSDDGEMAGWVNKLRIAQAIQAGTAAPHEIAAFQAEIAARAIPGEDLPIFVGKVLRNAGFFGHASGLVDGIKRRAQDAVNAATTPTEVEQALTQAQASAEAAFDQLMAQVQS